MMQRQRFLALALAAAGLMAYTGSAAAQTGEQPPARAGADSARRMFDPVGRILEQRTELKLTDEQATRLEAIRARYLEKNQPQMEKLRRDREARAAFRASMDSTRTEVLAVLTPEQQKQVKEMRKKSRDGWHGRRHGHEHGHDGDD
jgi:Spy/CpxP family protein refolding chaperone